MVETTSVREEEPKLSARDRLCLIQTINALPPTQFDELVFALNPPKGIVASSTAAQGQRSKDLLDWLEGSSGPGLAAADEVLQVLIPKATKTAPQPVAFVMMGRMGDLAPSELEAIVELLRQKTGDTSIALAFSTEGSIKLILNGSPEGLAKLQELFESGELEQLDPHLVEEVTPIDSNTLDARKARLIQALRLSYGRVNRALARALALARSLANDLDPRVELDFMSDFESNFEPDIDFARARDIANVLARDLARNIDLGGYPNLGVERARDLALALTCANALDRYLDLDRYLARDSDREIAYEGADLARDLARALENAGARVLEGAGTHDLSNTDLSGANLRDLSFVGVNLTDADLTNSDVTRTSFGNNQGITEEDKQDLQSRGAIFLDPPKSDVPALVLR